MTFSMLLIIIALILTFYWYFSPDTSKKTKPDCPPHKWAYHQQGFMHCTKCKFVAGSDEGTVERNEYPE